MQKKDIEDDKVMREFENNMGNFIDICLIRQPMVTMITSVVKKSIPDAIEKDGFPEPVEISERNRAWLFVEIRDWVQKLIDNRDKKIALRKESEKNV